MQPRSVLTTPQETIIKNPMLPQVKTNILKLIQFFVQFSMKYTEMKPASLPKYPQDPSNQKSHATPQKKQITSKHVKMFFIV